MHMPPRWGFTENPDILTDAAPLGLCVWQFDFLMLNLQKRNANSMEEP